MSFLLSYLGYFRTSTPAVSNQPEASHDLAIEANKTATVAFTGEDEDFVFVGAQEATEKQKSMQFSGEDPLKGIVTSYEPTDPDYVSLDALLGSEEAPSQEEMLQQKILTAIQSSPTLLYCYYAAQLERKAT
jgi:hypothetical protein